VFEPQFPHGMRNAATTYASSARTDVAAYEDLPGHHLLAVRNLITSTNDDSYHGSASELQPATSHGYAEWDFSGVLDPVMFQRFLDAADYWFGYSDDSSTGSYDPARECFVVVVDNQADGANATRAGDGEAPRNPRASIPQNPGPCAPPPRRRGGLTSTHSWPKRASSRLSLRRNTTRYDCFAPPLLEKLPRTANERASWVGRPATASTLTSMSTTRTRPCERARSSSQPRRCCEPCPLLHAGGAAGQPANQGRTPVREWILDTRGQDQDGDTHNIINTRRMGNTETRAVVGYHPRRGGRYDSREDRSPTPEPPGTRVFSREIRTTSFPQRFRQPTSMDKYTRETNPRVWLNDYLLACQLGGATTDEVIIHNLLLHLADSARTWLEHLPASQIHNWDDLVRTFVGNFQGTYVHPGNYWDLRACTQKPGESLRDFIRRFSKCCTELSSVTQSEIVHAFLEGTTCRYLVRELGRSPPVDSNELFDIATSFASGEEAVGAIFDGKKGKRVDDEPAEGSKSKEPQQKHKRGKKGKKAHRKARAGT
jgi:hypothetical protein